ncbi:hypothetical protein MRQ36_04605 [Micromonospora sp. R77]|uniref:hypothetical protein n=1 Tax=Micromonospora sp. R77 TaxID=2925836 RepID=UPI001F621667|nr:hypothetical protein [Micromonospora sp. R77]MCI4061886.1 hypothetical protein [Micromonospora sp. R77]
MSGGYDRWRDPAEPSWAAEPTTEWRPQFPGQRYPGDIGIEYLTPPPPRGRAAVVGRAEVRPVSPAPDEAYPVSPATGDPRGTWPVSPATGGYADDRDRRPRSGPAEPDPGRYDHRAPEWTVERNGGSWHGERERPHPVRPDAGRWTPDAVPQRPVSPAAEPGWLRRARRVPAPPGRLPGRRSGPGGLVGTAVEPAAGRRPDGRPDGPPGARSRRPARTAGRSRPASRRSAPPARHSRSAPRHRPSP